MKIIEHFIDQQAAAEQEFMENFHRKLMGKSVGNSTDI